MPIPTTSLTADFDASVMSGHVYAGISGGVPAGGVSSGGQVGAWRSTVDTDQVFIPNDSVTVFQPPDITWEDDTLLFRPSIQVTAGNFQMRLASNTSDVVSTDDLVNAGAKTVAISFMLTGTLVIGAVGGIDDRDPLLGNNPNEFFAFMLTQPTAGNYELAVYNWDGTADAQAIVIQRNVPYVAVMEHNGTTLGWTLYTTDGVVVDTKSYASGNTTNVAGPWNLGFSSTTGTRQLAFRVGQVSMYAAQLSAGDKLQLDTHYIDTWLREAPPATIGLGWGTTTEIAGPRVRRYSAVPSGLTPPGHPL
jgi:hypothetical protein